MNSKMNGMINSRLVRLYLMNGGNPNTPIREELLLGQEDLMPTMESTRNIVSSNFSMVFRQDITPTFLMCL
jgi:hypothetical protein